MFRADNRGKYISPELIHALDTDLAWYPESIKSRLRFEFRMQQAEQLRAEKPWRRSDIPALRSIEEATEHIAVELYRQEQEEWPCV